MESKAISLQTAKSSIDTFSYLTHHLRFENTASFKENLKEFIKYTETDPFFKLVHKALLDLDDQAFEKWFESQTSKKQKGTGLSFPPQSEERIPLVYMLLKKINDGTISLHSFFHVFFEGNSSSLLDFEIKTLLEFYGDLKDKMLAGMRQIRKNEKLID